MDISFANLKKFFHAPSARDIIYAAVLIIFLTLGAWIFVRSAVFLAKKINTVAGGRQEAAAPSTFDLVKFSLIAKRLNIPFSIVPAASPPETAPASLPAPAPKPPPPAAEPAKPDFSLIKALILNGTTISGLAGTWQARLKAEGFTKTSIGNASRRDYTGVTIRYKPSTSGALAGIRGIVEKHGAKVTAESETEESAPYDITLVIGK